MTSELSVLLQRCSQGDLAAEQVVFERTYAELKKIARYILHASRQPNQLQPTALLHEAFLKMPRAGEIDWNGRQHFFAIAARAMRRALVDQIRQTDAKKRPPEVCSLTIEAVEFQAILKSPETALMVDEILTEFEQLDPKRARIIEMRVFCGMTHEEIGDAVGKSSEAVKKDWKIARLWLQRRLK